MSLFLSQKLTASAEVALVGDVKGRGFDDLSSCFSKWGHGFQKPPILRSILRAPPPPWAIRQEPPTEPTFSSFLWHYNFHLLRSSFTKTNTCLIVLSSSQLSAFVTDLKLLWLLFLPLQLYGCCCFCRRPEHRKHLLPGRPGCSMLFPAVAVVFVHRN